MYMELGVCIDMHEVMCFYEFRSMVDITNLLS